MIDSRYLAILREVDRQGSVTAAAEKLNVSQSALSHMVKKLEERHNIKIWIKKSRKLHFTQAGQYLLSMAERVLPQLEQAENVLSDFSLGKKGSLRVGMECHPCQKWLMKVTGPYLSEWPEVNYEVLNAFNFSGVGALVDHEIDVLITPDPVIQTELDFTPIFDYELVLVVHEDHPLAIKEVIEPKDLMAEELITVPVSVDRLDIYTRFLKPENCQPRRHVTAETSDLILQLVAANRGVAVLPDWIVKADGKDLPVVPIKLGICGLAKHIYIGVRKGDEKIDFIDGFIRLAGSISV